jgi:RNA recognition motif-containing protein
MTLFVGKIPTAARLSDLEDLFLKFGKLQRCDLKIGTMSNYGFIEFEDDRDQQDLLKAHGEQEIELLGSRLVVEEAKGRKKELSNACFKCGK